VQRSDAIVVGAGLSGLVAARELVRSGLDVLVLEANDRPGGRTELREVNSIAVDLGGEWVDEAHQDLKSLVADLGLALRPFDQKKESARWWVRGEFSDEMPLSGRDAEVYRRMRDALVATASGVDLDAPWKQAPAEDVSVEAWLRDAGIGEEGLHVVETLVSSCGSTVPLGRMSFYSYAVKVATRGGPGKGNEYRVEGGAGRGAEAVAAELGERVRYSSPVVQIKTAVDGVEVLWEGRDGPGSARAERVVLAVPFTCLRDVRFDPAPPPVFRRLISGARYGAVRKVAFVFDEPVDPAVLAVTDTALGYCAAAQGDPPRAIVSFGGGEPLLRELRLPEGERKKRAARLLRDLYDLPEPVSVVEKVWTEERYARGSYVISAPGDMRDFGRAMGGAFGGVHLAGADGYTAAPSFMNSAVRSGTRAAREVAEALETGAVGLG
jgi:monoamine oxidase